MVPKIPPMPYRKVHRFLRKHGFEPIRQTGGHVVFRHPDGRQTVVPRHAGDVDPELVAEILYEAGINRNELRRKA
jgi:predicted RNA binding protein YcfA (HicA-like mRNA interferase family)